MMADSQNTAVIPRLSVIKGSFRSRAYRYSRVYLPSTLVQHETVVS